MDIHKFIVNDKRLLLDVNSGSLHIIDNIVWDILDSYPLTEEGKMSLMEKYDEGAIDEALRDILSLEKEGMLFRPSPEFPPFSEDTLPQVKALCIHISHDCNLRCRYCFAKTGGFGGVRSHMSPRVAMDAMDFIASNSGKRRNLEIDFFGGEPLMNFEAVKAAVRRAREIEQEKDKNFRFSLTTNGILITDEIKDFLNENRISLILSLDGSQETNDLMRVYPDGRGSYNDTVPKILEIIESRKGKNYYVRGTYTRKTMNFSDTVLHLADLGFKNISLEPVVALEKDYSIQEADIPFLEKEYDRLTESYIKKVREGNPFNFFHFNLEIFKGPCLVRRLKGCGAGTEYMAVTPEGNLYPCHQLVNQKEFLLGDIYNGMEGEKIRKDFHRTTIFEKKNCPECWARFFCSGGCFASALLMNRDITLPDRISCALQKKRIECALGIQAILKQENINWRPNFF